MKEQLRNPLHYEKLDSNPSTDFVNVIFQWGKKCLEKGQINEDIALWVVNNNTKSGKTFGTIKTHKEGNPLRLIYYILLWHSHRKPINQPFIIII